MSRSGSGDGTLQYGSNEAWVGGSVGGEPQGRFLSGEMPDAETWVSGSFKEVHGEPRQTAFRP